MNAGVHACAGGADVSFRDVKIKTPDRKYDRGRWMTLCPEALRIWGIWEKWVSWELDSELSGLAEADKFVRYGCHTWWGADGKVIIERLSISLPYVEKPFNSKVIKSFIPELRSRKCFRVSGFLCYLYMSYEHSICVSHIHVWLCCTKSDKTNKKSKKLQSQWEIRKIRIKLF